MGQPLRWIDRLFVRTDRGATPSSAGWSWTAARALGLAGGAAALVLPPIWLGVGTLWGGGSMSGLLEFYALLYLISIPAATAAAAITGGLLWYVIVERLGARRSSEAAWWWQTPNPGSIVGGLTGLVAPVGGMWIGLSLFGMLRLLESPDIVALITGLLAWGGELGFVYLVFGGWLTIPLGMLVGRQVSRAKATAA